MEFVTFAALLLTALIFILSFQYQAPRFSNSGVSFTTSQLGPKLLFALLMTAGTTVISLAIVLALSVTVLPVFSVLFAMAAPHGPLPGLLLLALMLALAVGTTQISNWLMTMAAGHLMKTTIQVESPAAAFKAAWAPTLWMTVLNAVFLFGPLLVFYTTTLNVH